MVARKNICAILLVLLFSYISGSPNTRKWPTVAILVLVRNKAHTLPYFLTSIEQLDYPKDRLYLWIHSEGNQDETITILDKWIDRYGALYHNVYATLDRSEEIKYKDVGWDEARFRHVIGLREKALDFARSQWADYIFMIDADVFLIDNMTLKEMVNKEKTIVAPLLNTDGLYSNFWCGMSDKYYYQRTEDYKPILSRQKKGCFEVPMVHSAVLIRLADMGSDSLTYRPENIFGYAGPLDDVIAFAISAQENGITLNVCNEYIYGFMTIPLEETDELADDHDQLLNVKLEAISIGMPLPLDVYLLEYVKYPTPSKFNFDEIYMINLEHRIQRRDLMMQSFKELGMDVKVVKAVNGKKLDEKTLEKMSITLMKEYEDPYHKRPMKLGEIGCFLSHYEIWQEMIEKGHRTALILEDDVHFEPFFSDKLATIQHDLRLFKWDLVYLGRKVLMHGDEQYMTENIVKPLYSYWTLGYMLSWSGAKKLVDARPMDNLLPVDEYLPIMFNQHPNKTWKSYFPNRNLLAFSAAPLLIRPTHYTGELGYISDTEDSEQIDDLINFKVEDEETLETEQEKEKETEEKKDNNMPEVDEKFMKEWQEIDRQLLESMKIIDNAKKRRRGEL